MTSPHGAERQTFPPGLMHRHACLLSFLALNPSLTRAQYMDVAGISRNTAVRDLRELRRLGFIRRVGHGPSSRYCLPNSPFDESNPDPPYPDPTTGPK